MLIDGRAMAGRIIEELREIPRKRVCFLALSESPATQSFIWMKMRVAEQIGVDAELVQNSILHTEGALEAVGSVASQGYDGIVVQLPLADGVDVQSVLNSVPTELDIDVLGEGSRALYKAGKTDKVPPVAGAVQRIFEEHSVDLYGKGIVVLGKGKLVGEPAMMLLERLGFPYTALDSDTPKQVLQDELTRADVIISGIGVPHFIKPEMVKEGVVLIDAGTSESAGKVVGDVDPSCAEKASLMTPVPGGVGPLAVAVLFANLWK